MSADVEKADQAFEDALARSGARDPREFYRGRLRELKQASPEAYEEAVTYYRETLVPSVAGGDVDPLAAWTEYGRTLAELTAPGRTVSIDSTGRAEPYDGPPGPDRLVLHMPKAKNVKALLVALPRELSEAQRSCFDWLVRGRLKADDAPRTRS
jgi:hypothetical protein